MVRAPEYSEPIVPPPPPAFATVIEPEIAAEPAVSSAPEPELPPMPLHLVFAPNRYVSHRLRVFIDWMTAQLQHGLA